ncbi:MAG: hypothetical protein HZA24_01010 [Nitrospirae bacterium]|nr:hypothetical protein [Nitrospirota bacterium]
MRSGLKFIAPILVAALAVLGSAAPVRADAWCTPSGGGVAVQLDPGGIGLEGLTCNGDLEIRNISPSRITGAGVLTVTGNLTFTAGATLQLIDTASAAFIDVGGGFNLPLGATIDGRGSLATAAMPSQPAGTAGAGAGSLTCGGSGAGHGGNGGRALKTSGTQSGGTSYGLAASPLYPGSMGGYGYNATVPVNAGGRGGAALRMRVAGQTTLDGLITVNGGNGVALAPNGSGGGGSGGAVLLSTGDLVTTTGGTHISAAGGNGGNQAQGLCTAGAGGAGGRVAVYYAGVNGGALGSALDAATHLSCAFGLKGVTGTALVTNGSAGTCQVSVGTQTPEVTFVTPAAIGQGASTVAMTVNGANYVAGSALAILDPGTLQPAVGITLHSVSPVPPDQINVTLSVGYTADAAPAANPKVLRVTNPDLQTSANAPLLTITAAPVIGAVQSGGQPVTALARGFSGTLVISGANFQAGATVDFAPAVVSLTGPAVVDEGAQTVTVPIQVATTAPAGPVAMTVVNPDLGRSQAPATFNVLSLPQIAAVSPAQITVGQGPVTLTVDGTGFIAPAQVLVGGTGMSVVPGSVQFVSFNRLTVQVTVDVEADLTVSATRDLWVDNGDGGVSPVVAFPLVPAVGVNQADVLYGQTGAANPLHRYWNGYGWTQVQPVGTPIPHTPEWVESRAGLGNGSLLVASLGAARDLYRQERTAAGAPVTLAWQAPVGPATVSGALNPRRAMDAAPVSGAAGERFLAVHGTPGGGLSYRVFGVTPATGAVPATDPACSGADEVIWVRAASRDDGGEALVTYAKANEALCAVVWRNGAFDAATERVLAPAGTLSALDTMAFDAVYHGAAPQQALVAWGVKGAGAPGVASWGGAAWGSEQALTAVTGASDGIAWLRLAASPVADRVAMANSTLPGGALVLQMRDATGWGHTFPELPAPMVSTPDRLSALNGSRPFDVVWSSTLDQAFVVYGKAVATPVVTPVKPQVRKWGSSGGWSTPGGLEGSSSRYPARWVQLTGDPASGDLLAAVQDMNEAAPGSGTLNLYQWDGVAWNTGNPLGTPVPETGQAFSTDYRFVPPPAPPTITGVTYAGVSPARIGANSTQQVLTINGTGFLNTPAVVVGNPGVTVNSVAFGSSTQITATVSIGNVVPGTYGITVTNPGGASASITQGLAVLPSPAAIRVLEVAATPCVPATAATACGLQDNSLGVEVRGTGIRDGATAVFAGAGTRFVGPATWSHDAGTGEDVLTGSVQVAGGATLGAMNVAVINADSSTGTGAGVFEVQPFVRVSAVAPTSIGAGAEGAILTVDGRNFQPGAVFGLGSGVLVRGTSLVSLTRALLTVDVLADATAGGHLVSVTNLDGGSHTSAAPLFSVLAGITVTSVTPASGNQGTTVPVHIAGTGLDTVNTPAEIVFSGTGLTVGNVVAAPGGTTLDFDVAIGQTAAFDAPRDLTLLRDNGAQITLARAFQVEPVPVIVSLSPTTVVQGETGLPVTITGTGFHPNGVVTAGAGVTVAAQTVVDRTRIDLVINVGAAPGTVGLFVNNPNGNRSAASPLTVIAAAPLTIGTGVTQITGSGTRAYSAITATGGELRIVGDITVSVSGDVSVTGGAIVFDPAQTYGRLRVGGNLAVGASGAIHANGTGHAGGRLGTAGSGPGGGAASPLGGVPGGRGGGFGGKGGPGTAATGGASYDLFGQCTDLACFKGVPLSMGSGGGSAYERPLSPTHIWHAGGAGGGALVLDVAGNVTVDGVVSANGTNGTLESYAADGRIFTSTIGQGAGGGSGGSVLILAGGAVGGTVGGRIEAKGGNASPFLATLNTKTGTGGGGGRVAVYHGVTNAFAGAVGVDGGTSPYTDARYAGLAGTGVAQAATTVTALTPATVARGVSLQAVIQGVGLVVGDGVLFTGTGLTGGAIAQPAANLEVPVSATVGSALGARDVLVRHADQTGGIAFGGITVVPNSTVVAVTPNKVVNGTPLAADILGSLFDPAAQVTIERAGVASAVSATVNPALSGPGSLRVTLSAPAGTPTGAYDVRVANPDGGGGLLTHGVVVTSPTFPWPALAYAAPGTLPAGLVDKPVTLYGYGFGVPGAFTTPVLASSDPNVTLRLDPAGCPGPGNDAACVADPAALQRIDTLVTTTGALGGEVVDVTVTQGAGTSTLVAALTLSSAPMISTVTPDAAVGSFLVTVGGANFASGAIISVDDANVVVGPTVVAGAALTAQIIVPVDLPTAATALRVTNPDAGQGTWTPWTVNPQPVVTSIGPISTVAAGRSATLDVLGSYFHPNATVSFGAGVTVSAPVLVDSGHLQVVVSVAATATPGPRTVSVTNHATRVPGELVDGFTVGRPMILQAVTPASVGAGAGSELVPLNITGLVQTRPIGFALSIAGQEFSSSMTLANIAFSQSGVNRLTRLHDVYTPAITTFADIRLTGYRAVTLPGGGNLTSSQVMVSVDPGADVGTGTLTVSNPDGSTSNMPFTINPAPVVTMVTPNKLVRGAGPVDLIISGFNLDAANPRVCIGNDCNVGAASSLVRVTSVRPQHPNRVDVTVQVDAASPLGPMAVKIANRDGGRATANAAVTVVSAFTVAAGQAFELAQGASGVAKVLTGQGFLNIPADPRLAFVLPDGTADPAVVASVTGATVTATSMDYMVTVGAQAAPGLRTLLVTNGDGATLAVPGMLLVTRASGPTIGAIGIPDGAGGFGDPAVGLAEWFDRTITGARLTGRGLAGGALALSFDLPGLAVSNLNVVDDQTATFDLTLPAAMAPGVAALTATTAAGTDVRSGALTVNAAPLITALQPGAVVPGQQNVNVLVAGAGFDPAAQLALSGTGITLRDFDPFTPGTQVGWIGPNSLRTVMDVSLDATGSPFVQVTNPDGGVGRFPLTIDGGTVGTPAKIAYLTGLGTGDLHVRDWAGRAPVGAPLISDPLTPGALPHSGTQQDLFTQLRANPMNPGEYLLAVAQARTNTVLASNLVVYRKQPTSPSWTLVAAPGPLDVSGGIAGVTTQRYDIAYEQAGPGRGLLVYGLGTGLWFQTHGTAASAPAPLLVGGVNPAATGTIRWVRLIPQPGSRRIMVMYQTDTRQIQALVWDGAAAGGAGAFVSQYDDGIGGPLTTNGPAALNTWDAPKRGFDAAWEALGGRAVAFFGLATTDAIQAVSWDPALGWGAVTQSALITGGTGPVFLDAKAAPDNDRIAVLATIPRAGERAVVAHFYNNGWEAGSALLNNRSAFSNGQGVVAEQNFGHGWTDDGRLVALYSTVYVTATGTSYLSRLDTRVWTPAGGWGAALELPQLHATGVATGAQLILVSVSVEEDPESGDLMAVVVDEGGIQSLPEAVELTTHLARWKGTGWADWAVLDNHMRHWSFASGAGGSGLIYGQTASIAYRDDQVPPAAVTLSATGQTATTATVRWTVPGDDGATGQAGGYDIRWSPLAIVDDPSVPDCQAPPAGQVCFSNANQVAAPPSPGVAGSTQSVEVNFGATGTYTVAVKVGDRASRVDAASGALVPWRNVSAMSNVLTVATLSADPIPPEAVTNLAAVAGANPESMAGLTWTGVGDDGGVSPTGPVRAYDLRIATLPISEVGGDNNFAIPFDRVSRSEIVAPAVDGSGGTRGVANAFTVTGLDAATTYYFAVKGLDEDNTHRAPVSNVPSVTTAPATPAAITDLIVSATGINDLTLAWTARGGAPTSYDLRFATDVIVEDASVADCANPPAGQVCMSRAARVLNTPTPVQSGVRQSVVARGLAPGTTYHFALAPVRYQTVGSPPTLTRFAPAAAFASGTTGTDPNATAVQPTAVGDLQVIAGTVRTHEAGLRWTAPQAADRRAIRYELVWATEPLAGATGAARHTVWVPLLPATTGVAQEYVLTDLPENAPVYIALRSYSVGGVASTLSNEVLVHTALRAGINAVSWPGSLMDTDVTAVLGGILGTCPGSGLPVSGSGPVGACANGETPRVTAFRWDPAAGVSGDFVAINVIDAVADPVPAGEGVFVLSAGPQTVIDVAGFDLLGFGQVALPAQNAALVSNPYPTAVALSGVRVIGRSGGVEVYNQPYPAAAAAGVVAQNLEFYTDVDGTFTRVPVGATEKLLPYRAYFVQLGGAADPALSYFVEVIHP